jgi:hypothetical protein
VTVLSLDSLFYMQGPLLAAVFSTHLISAQGANPAPGDRHHRADL